MRVSCSGWVSISIPSCTSGTSITLRHAEILQADGSGMIYTDNLRSAKATDTYICSGVATGETYEPRCVFCMNSRNSTTITFSLGLYCCVCFRFVICLLFFPDRFTYHGFRYVELTGFPGSPTLDTLMGRLVHSNVDTVREINFPFFTHTLVPALAFQVVDR